MLAPPEEEKELTECHKSRDQEEGSSKLCPRCHSGLRVAKVRGRVSKTTKKTGQIKEARSMRIMATETGGLWPWLATPGSTKAFLCKISLLLIVMISFPITLKTIDSRKEGCALFLPFHR